MRERNSWVMMTAWRRRFERYSLCPEVPNRIAERDLAFAASATRSFGGAVVVSAASKDRAASATSSTARSNATRLASDGVLAPLTFRTNCNEAARISSSLARGDKL